MSNIITLNHKRSKPSPIDDPDQVVEVTSIQEQVFSIPELHHIISSFLWTTSPVTLKAMYLVNKTFQKMYTGKHLCNARLSTRCEVVSFTDDCHLLRCKCVGQFHGSMMTCGRLIACKQCAKVMTQEKYETWLIHQLKRFKDSSDLVAVVREWPKLAHEYVKIFIELENVCRLNCPYPGHYDVTAGTLYRTMRYGDPLIPCIQSISSEWEDDKQLTWCKKCRITEKELTK